MKSAKYQLPKKLSQILTRKGLTLDEFLDRLGTNLQDWCDAESVIADVEIEIKKEVSPVLELLPEPTIQEELLQASDSPEVPKKKRKEQ